MESTDFEALLALALLPHLQLAIAQAVVDDLAFVHYPHIVV